MSSVFAPRPFDSPFLLRRIVSHQSSSSNAATTPPCRLKTAFPNVRRTATASTAHGKSRRSSSESSLRPCRSVRAPSAVVLLAFVLLLIIGTKDGANAMPNEWEEQRMCGRLLIQALKMVCNHQYAQPNRDNFYETTGVLLRVRRSSASRAYVVKRQRQPTDDGAAPMAAPHGAMGRNRRGIIWECCTNKCSLNYIRNNYCAAPPHQSEQTEENAAFQLEDERRRRK
ncbi:hypothetical protein niasHT_016058 [Heterodera trifolii]|uniref:Insulin-like domain-containing protein n=1 Tax=Heterodera trifolii TaxID=157864 RepID=A0ABD2LHB4_9BILA